MDNVYLKLRPARTEEISPDAQVGLLSSFLPIGKRSFLEKILLTPKQQIVLEIHSFDQKTHFYMVPPTEYAGYFESQVLSQYPKTLVEKDEIDPLEEVRKEKVSASGLLKQAYPFSFPLRMYSDTQEQVPLSAILGFLSKLDRGEGASIQMLWRVANQKRLQNQIRGSMERVVDREEGTVEQSPYKSLFQQKLDAPLLEGQIRLMFAAASKLDAEKRLHELAGAFGVYTLSEGNGLVYKRVNSIAENKFEQRFLNREMAPFQPKVVVNLKEAASLWHLPDKSMENLKAVDWGKVLLSEAPDDLPVSDTATDKEKQEINFFAKTEWRNHEAIFGIKRPDRRKHVYIIGKTGTGKSTLIANKAINDIRNGEGLCVIDPHGDLCEMILDYIPKRRINDVIYLDPTLSDERAFSLNLFDAASSAHKDVVASGIVSVFHKLYGHSWGPRLEYILRNTILSLLHYGNATFADIPRLLTDKKWRKTVTEKVFEVDEVLGRFWRDEFEQMNPRLQTDAISPILNKVGQFLSAERIRRVVGVHGSTVSIEEVMDEGKILLVNLSQGKLGEDTAALMGAMFITKVQLAAMQRVHVPEEERKDFFLYVDEFQNFATSSFIKILSEARKYRLSLILANQYIGQVDEDIQKAIFGNVGTLVSFLVGAADAELLQREFGSRFEADDLVSIGKYQILLQMAIDGMTCSPFLAHTLPLPSVVNNNREKIERVSEERYYKQV